MNERKNSTAPTSMASNALIPRSSEELNDAFALADFIIRKNYLALLEELPVIEPDKSFVEAEVRDSVSLFNITKLVYNKDENNLQKLINVYSSLVGMNSSLAMIVNSNGIKVDVYLGTVGASDIGTSRMNAEALLKTLQGNFPGTDVLNGDILRNDELKNVIAKNHKLEYISSVSGVGSMRTKNDVENVKFVQGLEKLLDTMQGKEFSACFIANMIPSVQLDDIKAEYESLYSRLSPFAQSNLSYSESNANGVMTSLANSLSDTVTLNTSNALSVGANRSSTHTEGKSDTITGGFNFGLSGGINSSAVPHMGTMLKSAFIGGAVGSGISIGGFGGINHSRARGQSWSDATTLGSTESKTTSYGVSSSHGTTTTQSTGSSSTQTKGQTLQVSYENKTVSALLARIDEQLKRIEESENYGIFASGAYFMAHDPTTARMAASAYKSLISGENTHVETAYINSWPSLNASGEDYEQGVVKAETIKKYLGKLCHPVFEFGGGNVVTPASMVSGRELALQMGLPRKSVPGVTVLEMASFGRNVALPENARTINLGSLQHMGRPEKGPNDRTLTVPIDIDSLTMHTFVTGSTGSGKSNTVYSILEKINRLNKGVDAGEQIHFLVIEPAKGEYKQHLGGNDDVHVYGTNILKTPLLRIDPFSFPNDIHVLEHIDRLVDIFNVCWPMYAAMPALLKDAIERAYACAGWDLTHSNCRYVLSGSPLYPTFADVIEQLSVILEESKYSSETKGDYIGALSTRLTALTNGLYRQIFTSNELKYSELFDENVIVDLSRVGSTETKSLIMGLLVMKMQEYRMANALSCNSRLRHLTVLEEAHNLLKRSSTEQNSETSNLLGKSVEMLANSIAEMRTYGEGFIIADQSPGLLDLSVIRNTNTKIIMRLPEANDR
ncbi:MAG: DUF87 domain-containing protein, partial [Pyramidobacter sp.]|nr:DUF87 domain-containing protein [Pyramidobacter sp.]